MEPKFSIRKYRKFIKTVGRDWIDQRIQALKDVHMIAQDTPYDFTFVIYRMHETGWRYNGDDSG